MTRVPGGKKSVQSNTLANPVRQRRRSHGCSLCVLVLLSLDRPTYRGACSRPSSITLHLTTLPFLPSQRNQVGVRAWEKYSPFSRYPHAPWYRKSMLGSKWTLTHRRPGLELLLRRYLVPTSLFLRGRKGATRDDEDFGENGKSFLRASTRPTRNDDPDVSIVDFAGLRSDAPVG